MMQNNYSGKRYPVEHLVFQIENPKEVERFIELDFEIWTKYLASFHAFVSKEVWINEENPGEVHTLVIWENMNGWKEIPLDELKRIDQKFKENFNHSFKITRRIHKEYNHGLYKVSHYQQKK